MEIGESCVNAWDISTADLFFYKDDMCSWFCSQSKIKQSFLFGDSDVSEFPDYISNEFKQMQNNETTFRPKKKELSELVSN